MRCFPLASTLKVREQALAIGLCMTCDTIARFECSAQVQPDKFATAILLVAELHGASPQTRFDRRRHGCRSGVEHPLDYDVLRRRYQHVPPAALGELLRRALAEKAAAGLHGLSSMLHSGQPSILCRARACLVHCCMLRCRCTLCVFCITAGGLHQLALRRNAISIRTLRTPWLDARSGAASVVPSVAAAQPLPPLPQWLRPPHHTKSLARKLQLRALGGGGGGLRSARALLPPLDLAGHVQHLQSMRGHQFAVYCISFDKLGRHIITGSDDTFIKVALSVDPGASCSSANMPCCSAQHCRYCG